MTFLLHEPDAARLLRGIVTSGEGKLEGVGERRRLVIAVLARHVAKRGARRARALGDGERVDRGPPVRRRRRWRRHLRAGACVRRGGLRARVAVAVRRGHHCR